ncbi:hypothetical protein Acsp03_47510 [Actinomadura sp. NBRC 104412]|uniref:hypothetical protein n=1 Tax=Actinomadura sp. NBRC 104412 TaxID=3032203 RepID=UPI00249FD399|nr:hypothetical protein [Actinomadura sp. NBRC 104412]GLZ07285.1 hypothetical protein Acsp03_47510 [Actinomadura sp. NBRC 104412]
MGDKPVTRWVSLDLCGGLVEEAIRETLDGRFFKSTVEEIQHTARRKVEELWTELEQVDDTTWPLQD